MIKGILIDYGGTIDTNGLHWAVVLKSSYIKNGIELPENIFNKAYVYGEKALAIQPLVKPDHTFLDVLRLKTAQQFIFLRENGYEISNNKIEEIAVACNRFAKETVISAIPVLETLQKQLPLIIVSNFYGNLNTVLEDFGIRKYFKAVVESAVVGIRKPDPAIYRYGVDLLGLEPEECMVVGDSFAKDIAPAKKIGCKAVWLRAEGWEEETPPDNETKADFEISEFSGMLKLLEN